MRHRFFPLVIVLAGCTSALADEPRPGLRFDSPGVLDLSESTAATGTPLPLGTLDTATASTILAAPTVERDSMGLKFSLDEYHCKTTVCAKEHEAQLIAATHGVVVRKNKRLTVATASGSPAVFEDWKRPTTKTLEGDEEVHWYLGRLRVSGYQRVEVQFGHDAPGSYLINPETGKTVFVHNAADTVALTADERHLVTFTEFQPLKLRAIALDKSGPRVELVCMQTKDDETAALQFKGRRDTDSFDLVMRASGRDVPVRVTYGSQGWSVAAADAASGITCSTGDEEHAVRR